jgi:hypothetical protein
MSLQFWFWVLFVIGIIFYGYGSAVPAWPGTRFGGILLVLLIGILGWQVFGAPVHH